MLRAIGTLMSERFRRWMPDPFVFAILLTIVVAGLALTLTPSQPLQILQSWYRGFWNLLEFGMQMVLILATGYAIALSPAVARFVDTVARRVNTPARVYFSVMVVGGLFSLVSWGWGVLTAVLARELAQRVRGLDYAFLIACVYFAGQPWVGGLSSSIPLVLNTPGNFLIKEGVLEATLSTSYTLTSTLNICYLAMMFLVFPVLMVFLSPRPQESNGLDSLAHETAAQILSVEDEADATKHDGRTLSDRLNHSVLLSVLIMIPGFVYIAWHFKTRGFDLDLNIMIFTFIMLGLVAHRTPMRYVIAVKRACSNISGIVFQYPFYAGIMGIMLYTGLGGLLSDWMAGCATLTTLPLMAQAAGGVVNMAIPSAGGEWAVVGPTFVEAAKNLGADLPPEQLRALIARVAMAVAYGETSTNALQPFFLLVVLPIMGAGVPVQARDVMGYLVLPFAVVYVLTSVLLIVTPM